MENMKPKSYYVNVNQTFSKYEVSISIEYNSLKWWQTLLVNIGYILLIVPGFVLKRVFVKKTGGSKDDRHEISLNKYNWRNELRNNEIINSLPFSSSIASEIERKINEKKDRTF